MRRILPRLRLEALEERSCPSCSVGTVRGTVADPGARLVIVGDSLPNTVTVREHCSTHTVEVVADGTPYSFPDDFAKIEVDLGAGNDTFRYEVVGGGDLVSGRDVTVHLGSGVSNAAQFYLDSNGLGPMSILAPVHINVYGDSSQGYTGTTRDIVEVRLGRVQNADVSVKACLFGGDDQFGATLKGDLVGTAHVTLDAEGGAEKDKLTVDAATDVDVGPDARLDVLLHGGYRNYWHQDFESTDQDNLSVDYHGELDGTLRLDLDGGAAGDGVSAEVALDLGSTGFLDATLKGSSGDDSMAFWLQDHSGAVTYLSAEMDGGSGVDTWMWWTSAGVQKQHFEKMSSLQVVF
jgi:hypothetical protein